MKTYLAITGLALLFVGGAWAALAAAPAEKIDPAEVAQKIAALAVADDTIPYDERPQNWLRQRREQVLPQLIAALADKNPKVAKGCLDVLWDIQPTKDLTDALIAQAGDANSPLRYGALRLLEKSASDPRVVRLLDQASTQGQTFPDPIVRARWAWLAGHTDRAVDILKPVVAKRDDSRYEDEIVQAIRLLGEIGGPGSVGLLEPVAAGDNWYLAVPAYQALAKIDPKNHGLTRDQAAFLQGAGFGGKESVDDYRSRIAKLAPLNAKEVRPFVMQMLRDKDWQAVMGSLAILTVWKDKDALPEIRGLLRTARYSAQSAAVAAYLLLEGGRQSQEDVLDLLKKDEDSADEDILRGIVMADIPVDRKVAMLHDARARRIASGVLSHALLGEMNRGRDIRELLLPLMDNETDLPALGGYCSLAAEDKQKRFAPQVRRALELLAGQPALYSGPADVNRVDGRIPGAGQAILEAVAAYDLKDRAADVRKLMGCANVPVRAAAQAAGAKLGIPGAMNDLYAQLNDGDTYVRERAAKALMDIKPPDETERAAREAAVLSCLGKPSEDYAMRVLLACGGEKTVKALDPILDDADVQRAVYAAWVMAQLPDKAAAAKALRRLAIFGMFHHQMYQQGAGIDFRIAPGLSFHQTTERLNPDPRAYSSGEGPVWIPPDMLKPFALQDAEQQYAVRCYRLTQVPVRTYPVGDHFLSPWRMWSKGFLSHDPSYLPLLKTIAMEDLHLKRLMVKGQAVAHFDYRQRAARAIAAITGEKATYAGLGGETLDSQAFPEPYKDQDILLARFVLDRIQKARPPANSEKDQQSGQVEAYHSMVLHIQEQFGAQVLAAIREEAKNRGVEMKRITPEDKP